MHRDFWGVHRLLPLLFLGILSSPTLAQDSAAETKSPSMEALRVETPPVVDGEVLGDPAWSRAVAATGFTQTTPREGEAASENTEVFVAFDDETLYIGVVCHDRKPQKIIISDSRRDASLQETDSFQILLDTYGDDQSGFIFGTNPAGIQYDGQVTRDGEVEVGSTGGFHLNWDGVWEVQAQIFDGGWSAEFAIPFRTLRFSRDNPQTWGINFQRNIRRRKEKDFWAPMPRQFDLDRVSLAGVLEEIEVPHQRLLQVTPYVLANFARGQVDSEGTEEDLEVGVDLKYGVTPSLTLDVTYNTDFAQVEADVQKINLDRFDLFFPEKRPFFLENAGLFNVGVPREVELFFSRRIGLAEDGSALPILGGARLSGKVGRNNIGLLYMSTDDRDEVETKDQFAVVRLARDLGENSSIGLLLTHRKGDGTLVSGEDHGSTFAVDGRWSVNPKTEIKGFAAVTDTPGAQGKEHAFRLGGRWNSRLLVAELSYTEIGDDFNPEVGFLQRRGYRRPEIFGLMRYRPKNFAGLQELRPHVFYQGYWDFDGDLESDIFHLGNHWEWKNGHEIHTGGNFRREGVKVPFEIFPGVIVPAGDYNNNEIQLMGYSNRGAPVGLEMTVLAGSFYDGNRWVLTPSLRFRIGEKFNAETAWNHNDIDIPGGAFTADLARLRLSYSFTPQLFVESLVQYNTRIDEWSSNFRFGWRDGGSAGLYLVYNEIQDIGRQTQDDRRQLIIKYSRLFDFKKR